MLNRSAILSVGLVLSLSMLGHAADTDAVRIERIVPEQAVVAVSIPNCTDFEAKLRRTPLWALLNTDQMKAYLSEAVGSAADGDSYEAMLEELGLDQSKLVKPEGTIAAAILVETDEETDLKVPAVLAFADFGANADKAQEMFDAVFTKLAEERDVKIEHREIRGRKVRSIELPKPAEAEDDDGGDPMDEMMPNAGELLRRFDTIHFARDGQRYFLASSMLALEDALEVIDGQKLAAPLADNKDFQAAMTQLGQDRDGWAILLTPSVQPLIGPLLAGPGAMVMPYVSQLFGDVRAYGFGLGMDGRDGMVTSTIGMHVPGDKIGLLSLVTGGTPKGDVPAFVGSDTVGFARMNVKFGRLMPLVREVAKGLPPMFAEQIDMGLQQFGPMLDQAFAEMGPEVYVTSTQSEPIGIDSAEYVIAIRSTKADAVKPLFSMVAPAMGLDPQDFLGNTLFADEFAPEAAIGVGGGWTTFGSMESVEQVLRSVGQKGESALAEEKAFRRGVAALPDGDLVGWGYNNLIAAWKSSQHTLKAQISMLADLQKEFGEDAELADSMSRLEKLSNLADRIPPELIEKYVGPGVWSFRGTPDGFIFRQQLLSPDEVVPTPTTVVPKSGAATPN